MEKPDLTARSAESSCQFGPDRRLTALCAGLAALAIAVVVLGNDRAGQLLAATAALILLAYVVTDLLFWPRLVASPDGLDVRTPTVRAHFDWSDVDSVRADARIRVGLRSVTLEIDASDTLIVFSRRALGADPETVANRLRTFG